jgi:deoxyribodipyrimidine photo-lyase
VTNLARILSTHPCIRVARSGPPRPGGRAIVYWMQRSQRGNDNPALNLAIDSANELGLPVVAVFALTAHYPSAQRRHYRFLIDGLVDAAADLKHRGVTFVMRIGDPVAVVAALAAELHPALVVGDENPVRIGQLWRSRLAQCLTVPLYFVDGDVVVPTSHFPNEEFAARTLRPKIHRVLHDYLQPIPNPKATNPFPGPVPLGETIEPDALIKKLAIGGAGEVADYRGGTREAERRLDQFVEERLERYAELRNHPTEPATSELSAHLHFGQISPVTIALAAMKSDAGRENIDTFLEELIVRRELAINFVARNEHYDSLDGCPEWALKSLAKHSADRRQYLYSPQNLEAGATHDPLWNAAQTEMVVTGRMHNYMRMYWAKKILEWTPNAGTAFAIAVDLNDRYEMDGRDPNGYAGIAWAIGGKHDRPWPERPVFGTIRYMSYGGASKKFDVERYIERVERLASAKAP